MQTSILKYNFSRRTSLEYNPLSNNKFPEKGMNDSIIEPTGYKINSFYFQHLEHSYSLL